MKDQKNIFIRIIYKSHFKWAFEIRKGVKYKNITLLNFNLLN
jgi:hypothetical protein